MDATRINQTVVELMGTLREELKSVDTELATLREDPRLQVPLDGPGSHRADLMELRRAQETIKNLKAEIEMMIDNSWTADYER